VVSVSVSGRSGRGALRRKEELSSSKVELVVVGRPSPIWAHLLFLGYYGKANQRSDERKSSDNRETAVLAWKQIVFSWRGLAFTYCRFV
jgi:hypothetical protein